MKSRAFGICDRGIHRECNEDFILMDEDLGLYMVADGMRGTGSGIPVSQLAIQIVHTFMARHRDTLAQHGESPSRNSQIQLEILVSEAISEASEEIYGMSLEDKRTHGSGTTLSVLGVCGGRAFIAHVGDTRVYLLREGVFYQLTDDHTLLYEYLKQGLITQGDLRASKLRKIVTRAVGLTEAVQMDFRHLELAPGDRFLLCSDGLHLYLRDDGEVERVFERSPVNEVPGQLVDLANGRGGVDNICAVVVDIEEPAAEVGLGVPTTSVRLELELLQGIPFFCDLDYSELLELHNLFKPIHLGAGEVVIQEGTVGDDFYLLVNGEVSVSAQGAELDRLGRGATFGEMALLDRGQRSATVVTTRPSLLVTVDRGSLFALMRKEPSLAVKILWSFNRTLTKRLRKANEALSAISDGDRDLLDRLSAPPEDEGDKPYRFY